MSNWGGALTMRQRVPAAMPTANAINAWTTDVDTSGGDVIEWFDDISAIDLSPNVGAPPAGTLSGLVAPDFDGAVPDDLSSGDTASLADIVNLPAWHWWIIANIAPTGGGGGGAQYYEIHTFATGQDGWFGIGYQDNGAISAGTNDDGGTGDFTLSSSGTGYDDSANHVVHVWFDGTNFNLRVDDEATVSHAITGAIRTMTDPVTLGVDWGFTAGLGMTGPMHQWTFGAMTAGEVTQAYAYLAATYGVTVP